MAASPLMCPNFCGDLSIVLKWKFITLHVSQSANLGNQLWRAPLIVDASIRMCVPNKWRRADRQTTGAASFYGEFCATPATRWTRPMGSSAAGCESTGKKARFRRRIRRRIPQILPSGGNRVDLRPFLKVMRPMIRGILGIPGASRCPEEISFATPSWIPRRDSSDAAVFRRDCALVQNVNSVPTDLILFRNFFLQTPSVVWQNLKRSIGKIAAEIPNKRSSQRAKLHGHASPPIVFSTGFFEIPPKGEKSPIICKWTVPQIQISPRLKNKITKLSNGNRFPMTFRAKSPISFRRKYPKMFTESKLVACWWKSFQISRKGAKNPQRLHYLRWLPIQIQNGRLECDHEMPRCIARDESNRRINEIDEERPVASHRREHCEIPQGGSEQTETRSQRRLLFFLAHFRWSEHRERFFPPRNCSFLLFGHHFHQVDVHSDCLEIGSWFGWFSTNPPRMKKNDTA